MSYSEKIKKFNSIIHNLKNFKVDYVHNSTLCNMGNSCYMNSVIQSLISNDNLMDLLFNQNILDNIKITHTDNNISFENNNTNIYFQLLLLIKGIFEDTCIIRPVSFKNWIGKLNKDFDDLEQHDAHEFLNEIINLLNSSLKTDFSININATTTKLDILSRKAWESYFKNEYSAIIDLYYGLYYNVIICNNCNNKSHTFEPFNSIILDIPNDASENISENTSNINNSEEIRCEKCGFYKTRCICKFNNHLSNSDSSSYNSNENPILINNDNNDNDNDNKNKNENNNISLIDCFDYTFKDEKFENTNLYYCDKCKTHNQATKKHYIWKLPPNLIIVFKRFNGLHKNNTPIKFNIENLDLNKYIYKKLQTNYSLYSSINHFGNILGGHYISISKRNNQWFLFDDEQKYEITNFNNMYNNSYILFYK